MKRFLSDRRRYLGNILGLLHPSRVLSTDASRDPNVPAEPASTWNDDDYATLLEEGRRHYDSANALLEAIRGRANFTFTAAVLLLGIVSSFWRPVSELDPSSTAAWAFLAIGLVATTLGLAGALSVSILPVRTSILHPVEVTSFESPVAKKVAVEYATLAPTLNAVNATLIDQLREATLFLTVGALSASILWAWWGH